MRDNIKELRPFLLSND